MNTPHCGRCDAEIKPGEHVKMTVELVGSRLNKVRRDLCAACDVELRRFMAGVKLEDEK